MGHFGGGWDHRKKHFCAFLPLGEWLGGLVGRCVAVQPTLPFPGLCGPDPLRIRCVCHEASVSGSIAAHSRPSFQHEHKATAPVLHFPQIQRTCTLKHNDPLGVGVPVTARVEHSRVVARRCRHGVRRFEPSRQP